MANLKPEEFIEDFCFKEYHLVIDTMVFIDLVLSEETEKKVEELVKKHFGSKKLNEIGFVLHPHVFLEAIKVFRKKYFTKKDKAGQLEESLVSGLIHIFLESLEKPEKLIQIREQEYFPVDICWANLMIDKLDTNDPPSNVNTYPQEMYTGLIESKILPNKIELEGLNCSFEPQELSDEQLDCISKIFEKCRNEFRLSTRHETSSWKRKNRIYDFNSYYLKKEIFPYVETAFKDSEIFKPEQVQKVLETLTKELWNLKFNKSADEIFDTLCKKEYIQNTRFQLHGFMSLEKATSIVDGSQKWKCICGKEFQAENLKFKFNLNTKRQARRNFKTPFQWSDYLILSFVGALEEAGYDTVKFETKDKNLKTIIL